MKIHVEVYLASRLLQREQKTFSAQDLIRRIHSEFEDDRKLIGEYVRAYTVANISKTTSVAYNYLWRLGPNQYRCYHPTQDQPHLTKVDAAAKPWHRDVSPEYHYLLEDGPPEPDSAPAPVPAAAKKPSPVTLLQVLSVESIMTAREDLLTVEDWADPGPVLANARNRRFDLVPVTKGGRVVGTIRTKSTKMEELNARWLVSHDTSILDLIPLLASSSFPGLFVTQGRDVIGLVTPADLNKLPVRVELCRLVGGLEMGLANLVRECYENDRESILGTLAQSRSDKTRILYDDLAQGNADVEVSHLLYLADLITCVCKSSECREILGYASRKEAENALSDLTELCGPIMRMARPVLLDVQTDLPKLHDRVQRARDVLLKLRGQTKQ